MAIQWFPGHMTKALREMEKEVKNQFDEDVNWFIPSEERTEAWKLEALGKTIYISKEMKKELMLDEWREWKKKTNAERCDIPSVYKGKMKKCRGNCSECEHTRTNIFHSFEEFEQEVNEGKRDPSEMVELCEEYSSSNFIEESDFDLKLFHQIVDSFDEVNKKIIDVLLTDAEATPGAISRITSIPKTTVQRRLAQSKKVIKDNKIIVNFAFLYDKRVQSLDNQGQLPAWGRYSKQSPCICVRTFCRDRKESD